MKAGDRVRLRPPGEIAATLDRDGCLDGTPFMPEMLAFFDRAHTVAARAERACDTIGYTGVRRIPDTVLLDGPRCDGGAHAGCGAQCLIYWKEAWLQPDDEADESAADDDGLARLAELTQRSVQAANSTAESPRYRCQATELVRASEPVGSFRFLRELTSGNVGVWRFMSLSARAVLEKVGQRLGVFRYNPFPPESLVGQRSSVDPNARELRPGQLVQIKSKQAIGATLDARGMNRGLWFDREMLRYCGQPTRVKSRVSRFIEESSGKLIELSSDAYILEGAICCGDRSENRWFCPRALYPWWRGVWLEPIEAEGSPQPSAGS